MDRRTGVTGRRPVTAATGGADAQAQLARCTSVGTGIRIEGRLHVENLGRIAVGDNVVLRSTPAMSHLVTGPHGDLRIGRGVQVGHGAAIACHESIVIGDAARIGPFAMILDTDFHEAGRHDSAGSTGAILIGAGARLGARVTVLRGSTIGDGAIIEPGSVVKGEVPAGARVAGNPARPVAAHGAAVGPRREIGMEAVLDVVTHTFGLAARPGADTPRDGVAAWDSLGMLNLLLSLEQVFGVSVSAEALSRVTVVGELLPLVEGAEAVPG
ncbi:MAG: acyltransferase [Gemmatimonadaceae bacterium]|nr:acyltransferase [Gemmatimonadaceae bacterium]